jgi:hypothetical protein
VYESGSDRESDDLWMLPLSGDRKEYPLVRERGNQRDAKFSPNGRWLAYTSNEQGRAEVFIQRVSAMGDKWMISKAGGSLPRWRHNGKELFYLAADEKLMAVPIDADASVLRPGAAQPLFQTRPIGALDGRFNVSPDGKRFLITTAEDPGPTSSIVVVSNWLAALQR